jgi:hypothetical protein
MILILVLDWARRYPVGASPASTEDIHHFIAACKG